jgi:hypothetical protein
MSTTLRQQVRRQMELFEFRALPLITRQDVNLEFQQELSDANISKSQEATCELVRASMGCFGSQKSNIDYGHE